VDQSSSINPDSKILHAVQALVDVVAQLRSSDGGCPWDLEQTPESLTPYVIEEAYETVDAIRQGDPKAIADELGDLLLQVVLQAQIAQEYGQFDLATVAEGITQKLIRRHPHVFGEVNVETVADVHANWERIKAAEEHADDPNTVSLDTAPQSTAITPRLQRYARSLPPIMAAMKISVRSAEVGFEWETIDGVWEKVHEELDEFQTAIASESQERQQEELGDLLFGLINIGRWLGLDPAEALQGTNDRFIKRFAQVESLAERPLADYTIDELEAFWQQAKAKLKAAANSQP
jgi:XTP/dITP diphosphohydrolase